jgi:hypothetical protein
LKAAGINESLLIDGRKRQPGRSSNLKLFELKPQAKGEIIIGRAITLTRIINLRVVNVASQNMQVVLAI